MTKMRFTQFVTPGGQACDMPNDIELKTPGHSQLDGRALQRLVYIPWDDKYLGLVPAAYQDFFQRVLPELRARTTNVHIAICLPFVEQLIKAVGRPVDERVVYIALILHDIGWSRLSDAEVAASLGVSGLKLTGGAVAPKERHAIVGAEMAAEILDAYDFHPALSPDQKQQILNAILYHDKPWELAGKDGVPLELQLVCDVDHLWSFTHENFWQDTVRKGVQAAAYLENLAGDLSDYFITPQAKAVATKLLAARSLEVGQLERAIKNPN